MNAGSFGCFYCAKTSFEIKDVILSKVVLIHSFETSKAVFDISCIFLTSSLIRQPSILGCCVLNFITF